MAEKQTSVTIRLPDDLLDSIDAAAKQQTRDRSKQIIHILREKFVNKPRLEDKQKTGSLRK